MDMVSDGGVRQTLSEDDKRHMRCALDIIDTLTAEKPTIPVQALRIFLLVCINEGLSMSDYQAQAGLSQTVTSRHLLDIGDRNRYMEPGLGWVTQNMDVMNRRRHIARLTSKGKALAHKLARTMTGRHP